MPFRTAPFLVSLMLAGVPAANAAPATVDACKLIDLTVANTAAKAWFGAAISFTMTSSPGPRGGTCDFTTESPKHIDFSVFYNPVANPDSLGLGPSTPPNMTPVAGAGDKAVYGESNDASLRYKDENFAVLKGSAVAVIDLTIDKGLAFVPKEKLAAFAKEQLVPKM